MQAMPHRQRLPAAREALEYRHSGSASGARGEHVTRIIGIDPPLAWAILELREGTSLYRHVAHGSLEWAMGDGALAEVVARFVPTLMGLELVDKVYPRREKGGISAAYATALYHSGVAAGALRVSAKGLGLRVVEVTAEQWRKALCGNAQATDKQVAQMVRLRVAGWPAPGKPGERTSTEHERDAAGVAIFVAERERLLDVRQRLNSLGRDPLGAGGVVRR